MDNRQLREHYEKTGNIMDVFNDPDVLRKMVQAEDECMGMIGAGFPAYSTNPQPVDPEKLRLMMQKVRLQSTLFTELEDMMNLANLGAGTEAGITEARRRIRQQLNQLTAEQQACFDALVAEDLLQPAHRPLQRQLKGQLFSLLSTADWDAVGEAAISAVQKHWMEFLKSVSLPEKKEFGDDWETAIDAKINIGVSADIWEEFHDLEAKRQAVTLTPTEHQRLIAINDIIEAAGFQRLQALVDLAKIRNKSLPEIMAELGISGSR